MSSMFTLAQLTDGREPLHWYWSHYGECEGGPAAVASGDDDEAGPGRNRQQVQLKVADHQLLELRPPLGVRGRLAERLDHLVHGTHGDCPPLFLPGVMTIPTTSNLVAASHRGRPAGRARGGVD